MKEFVLEIMDLSDLDQVGDAQEMQDRLEQINDLCKEYIETQK